MYFSLCFGINITWPIIKLTIWCGFISCAVCPSPPSPPLPDTLGLIISASARHAGRA